MRQLNYLIISILISSCNVRPDVSTLDKERTFKEVFKMLNDYHHDIAKQGLTAEFKYLDDSPDFFWVPPGYRKTLSYDSVKAILVGNDRTVRSIKLYWDTLNIIPLTNKIANYSGIVRGTMIDTAGTKTGIAIIESGTVIKRADGWKLLSGQSAILPEETVKTVDNQ